MTKSQPQDHKDHHKSPASTDAPRSDGQSLEQTNSVPNPFAPENLRISQDFGESLGVKKELLTIPVRKPSKEWWVRTHPDSEYRLDTAVVELKEENEDDYRKY